MVKDRTEDLMPWLLVFMTGLQVLFSVWKKKEKVPYFPTFPEPLVPSPLERSLFVKSSFVCSINACMYVFRRVMVTVSVLIASEQPVISLEELKQRGSRNVLLSIKENSQSQSRTHTQQREREDLHLVSKEARAESCRVFCSLFKCCHSNILGHRLHVFRFSC